MGRIDPGGASTGTATHIFGGIRIETEMVSASVKVNSDCTGLMEHTILNKTVGGTTAGKSPIVVLNNGEKFIALYVEGPGFMHYSRTGMQ